MIGDDSGTSAALSDFPLFEHLHPSCFGSGFVFHSLHLLPLACLTPLVYTLGCPLSIVLGTNLSHQNIIKIMPIRYGLGIVHYFTSYAQSYQMVTSKMAGIAL